MFSLPLPSLSEETINHSKSFLPINRNPNTNKTANIPQRLRNQKRQNLVLGSRIIFSEDKYNNESLLYLKNEEQVYQQILISIREAYSGIQPIGLKDSSVTNVEGNVNGNNIGNVGNQVTNESKNDIEIVHDEELSDHYYYEGEEREEEYEDGAMAEEEEAMDMAYGYNDSFNGDHDMLNESLEML